MSELRRYGALNVDYIYVDFLGKPKVIHFYRVITLPLGEQEAAMIIDVTTSVAWGMSLLFTFNRYKYILYQNFNIIYSIVMITVECCH